MPTIDSPLPADPVFKAPWEAQAFAMVVSLHARGAFTWPEWAAVLAEVISESPPDEDGSRYYQLWLTALERITVKRGLLEDEMLHRRMHEWEDAVSHTPHGKPVVLKSS